MWVEDGNAHHEREDRPEMLQGLIPLSLGKVQGQEDHVSGLGVGEDAAPT